MIEKIFVISFLVFAIWYSMKPDEIFSNLAEWLERTLPKKIHPPIFECPVCMAPWYGSVLYWLIWGLWKHTAQWQEWPIVVIGAMGLNAIFSHLFPPDKSQESQ